MGRSMGNSKGHSKKVYPMRRSLGCVVPQDVLYGTTTGYGIFRGVSHEVSYGMIYTVRYSYRMFNRTFYGVIPNRYISWVIPYRYVPWVIPYR